MSKSKNFILFAALTFGLLGLVPLSELLFAASGDNLADVAARAAAETGLVWTSSLLVVIRMSSAEPGLLALLLGSLVPTLAALTTLALMRRPGRWQDFFSRFHPLRGTPIRAALRSYGIIFLLLIPLLMLVLALRKMTGGDYSGALSLPDFGAITMILTLAFLDQGAVLEEPGWRAFASPELERVMASPLQVALIVGILWGLWHLPRDLTTGVPERLGTLIYLGQYLPSFLLGTVAVSVIAAYFMNRLGGSVIPAIMVHGITNDAAGISGSASIVVALTPYHQITKNGLLALLAVGIILLAGTSLGRRSE